jgi:N-methylhydantoinase B
MIHGSKDTTVDFVPYAGLPQGAFGLFGGYPVGSGGIRAIVDPGEDFPERLAAGHHPVDPAAMVAEGEGGRIVLPSDGGGRVLMPEGQLQADITQGGGGYGDPLLREPERVARDVRRRLVSERIANLLYGVVLDAAGKVDSMATQRRRGQIRDERRTGVRERTVGTPTTTPAEVGVEDGPFLRFHETLEIVGVGPGARVRCRRCGHGHGPAGDNYKRYAVRRDRSLEELADRPMPDGSPYLAVLREYACPGCATLLQVDVWCPDIGGEEDLWDIRIVP